MRLSKLKEKLEKGRNTYHVNSTVNHVFQNKRKKDLDDVKIIGITGSRGKTTVANIVHEYLKSKGYKSILYSSSKIDSPSSIINPYDACEVPIKNEEMLFDIIEQAETYDADYLVLEINESTIEKGFLNDVDFDVKVLTNIIPTGTEGLYTTDEYLNLKKSFFENTPNPEECKCVMGFVYYTKELFEEFLNTNSMQKYLFSTNYTVDRRGMERNKFMCLLDEFEDSINGLFMKVKLDNKFYTLGTNLFTNNNALNILCAMTILKALDIFDINCLNKVLRNITIPGRLELIKANFRYFLIDTTICPVLDILNNYKANNEIDKIKVVLGSAGKTFSTWDKKYKTDEYKKQRDITREKAMNYLKDRADEVYLTSNDNGGERKEDICKVLQNHLGESITTKIVLDRKEAIERAIKESDKGDLILISGRGNRNIFCDDETHIKLFKDKDVVLKVLDELGWL